jgi:hypothetical protein
MVLGEAQGPSGLLEQENYPTCRSGIKPRLHDFAVFSLSITPRACTVLSLAATQKSCPISSYTLRVLNIAALLILNNYILHAKLKRFTRKKARNIMMLRRLLWL